MNRIIFFFTIVFAIILIKLFYKKKLNDIYYIEDFLCEKDFKYIKDACNNINESDLKNESFRKIYPIKNDKIYNIFYCKKNIKKISKIINTNIFKSEFPIEYRIYPEKSKGMKCHKDIILFDKPQFEVVFTIENTSDSYTSWYDYNGYLHKIYTKPNSILIVKAGGNTHCVSEFNKGYRSILKLIYTQSYNYNNNYYYEQNRITF